MRQTWRWFGQHDLVSLSDIRQAGAQGVVSALHHLDNGEVWTSSEIRKRLHEIQYHESGAPTGLTWDVVESLPVSEDIKKQDGAWRQHIEHYKLSLRNLAECGLSTVCYNFMPVLDWTRTDLRWQLPNGATCMRFDYLDYLVFDVHVLQRPGADASLDDATREAAQERFDTLSGTDREQLIQNIVAGLPGANQTLTVDSLNQLLRQYQSLDEDRLRANLITFLDLVVPTAEDCGVRLCCHPDDPPFPLLGLPRVVSTEQDYQYIVKQVSSASNGVTLCSGSLGARPDNDLPGMMRRLGSQVHFLHLRNVQLESEHSPGSFHESEHLVGSTDMVALIREILAEESRRQEAGRTDCVIPMRPDHGQDILDDLQRQSQPGYPAIGRLKGLAELRGVAAALAPQGS